MRREEYSKVVYYHWFSDNLELTRYQRETMCTPDEEITEGEKVHCKPN